MAFSEEDIEGQRPKRKTLEEQQWEALNSDDLFLAKVAEGMAAKGIDVAVPPPPPMPEERPTPAPKASATRRVASAAPKSEEPPSSYEQAILTLLDVRDLLIASFRKVSAQKELSNELVICIRKTEDAVKTLGGTIEPFNRLAELSGLIAQPDAPPVDEKALLTNALRVAENTQSNYSLFPINKIMVKLIKDRPGILLQIQGVDNGAPFLVNGQVVAKTDFNGNEVLDYVRDGGQQRFTVRAMRLGKWMDVGDDYIIRYKDVTDAIPKG